MKTLRAAAATILVVAFTVDAQAIGATGDPTQDPTMFPTTVDATTWGPTKEPTGDPTNMPTILPTLPTSDPTSVPTLCVESDIYAVNWHELLNGNVTGNDLLHSSSVEFAASTLSLTFSVGLEYVGLSADGNFDDEYKLGTSYWIDFQSFGESIDVINEAGSCGNRRSDDYDGLTFSEYWGYTVNPQDLEGASTEQRMAYPPSDWTLDASDCNIVGFERTFSWTQLTACEDYDGDSLVAVTQTASSILLSGTFFVELVSPYSMDSTNYYRTYPLVQQDFVIALSRTVNVMASTGVQLFITSVLAFARDDDGSFEMTILVQSADYVELVVSEDEPLWVISMPSGLPVNGTVETVAAECLVASSFTCGQIFTLYIPAECPSVNSVVDLSGDWQFAFAAQCRTENDDPGACNTFMANLDGSGRVVLDLTSSYQAACSVNVFNVTFQGELTFYSDSDFSQTASDSFVIGQDTIYGEVVVDYLADEDDVDYEFLNVSIEKVWVCTAANDNTADLAATLNNDNVPGVGGCFSSLIDDDGPYTVIGDNAGPYEGSTNYTHPGNHTARFSFLTFDTPKTTIAVHVQLLLTLLTGTGTERRRMLLEVDPPAANELQHFLGTVSVAESDAVDEETAGDAAEASSSAEPVVVAAVGGAIGVALIVVAVVLLLAMRSRKRQRAHRGNDDHFNVKPDADLAHHIAVQSSTAGDL